MDSAPLTASNQPPDPQSLGLSQEEAMHVQEIHRANMACRAFYKKLEQKAADWRMHRDFLTSTQLEGDERLQAERRCAAAEGEFNKVLVARERGAEGPYRHSLYNYRSWQESHPQQAVPSSEPSAAVTAPLSGSDEQRQGSQDAVLSSPAPDVASQQQTASHSEPTQPFKMKKPIPLVVRTPAVVKNQQPLQPEPQSAREKLKASIGAVQTNEMPIAHTFEWQLQSMMTPEVFVMEPEKRTDWTTVRSDYAHGAEAGLRQLFVQRTRGPSSTIVEVDEEEFADGAADKPTEIADNEQETTQRPESPPDWDSDETYSVCSDSGPGTPVAEAAFADLLGLLKVDDLDAIEELTAEGFLSPEHEG